MDIKERTNKRGGKGPTMRCNSDTGHKVVTSPTGQKPCRRRPLCAQSLVYKFIAHYHFIRQRYSLRVARSSLSLSSLLALSLTLDLVNPCHQTRSGSHRSPPPTSSNRRSGSASRKVGNRWDRHDSTSVLKCPGAGLRARAPF